MKQGVYRSVFLHVTLESGQTVELPPSVICVATVSLNMSQVLFYITLKDLHIETGAVLFSGSLNETVSLRFLLLTDDGCL